MSCLSTCSQLASHKSSVLQRDRQLGSRWNSESVMEVCEEEEEEEEEPQLRFHDRFLAK